MQLLVILTSLLLMFHLTLIVKSVIELLLFKSGRLVTLKSKKKLHLWGRYFGDISVSIVTRCRLE